VGRLVKVVFTGTGASLNQREAILMKRWGSRAKKPAVSISMARGITPGRSMLPQVGRMP